VAGFTWGGIEMLWGNSYSRIMESGELVVVWEGVGFQLEFLLSLS